MTRLEWGAATDTGRVRTNNEDNLFVSDRLFVVADGMGGHRGGEVASQIAVAALRANFSDQTVNGLITAVRRANEAVFSQASGDPDLRGMGTTLVAIAPVDDAGDGEAEGGIAVVNVGDSRLYLLRDGELQRVTEDHSLVEEMVRDGRISPDEALTHPRRNIVTRALGIDGQVDVDGYPLIPYRGDRFLLCSDGLYDEVDDARIAATLRRLADPTDAANELVRLANEHGGHDNISVIVVDVVDDDERSARASAALGDERPAPSRPRDGDMAGFTAPPPPPAPPDEAVAVPPSGRSGPRAARRRRSGSRLTWRVAVFGLVFLVILGGAAGAVGWYARKSYYVGFDGDRVAVFKGRPDGVLWFDPTLEETTTIARTDVPAASVRRIESGHEVASLDDAHTFLDNLQEQIDDLPGGVGLDVEHIEHIEHLDHRRLHADVGGHDPTVIRALRRNTELGLILLGGVITGGAYTLASLGRTASLPANIGPFLVFVLALLLVAHIATRRLAPGADPVLLPIAGLLNGIGYVFIARLDEDLAGLQATWTAVGVAAYVGTLLFVRRVRDLERYRYTFMLVGVALLMMPLLPVVGRTINGARIWASVGPINFQPGEFAKIVLAIFFASYLVERRELLGMTTWPKLRPILPDPKYLGPVLLAWGSSLVVMTAERDLGSSLLFFALFMLLLWVATERSTYLVVGAGLFGVGAFAAYNAFSHVQERVSIWLDPWQDPTDQGFQVIQSWFAMAWGGVAGTGLGLGNPDRIPVNETDFIFAAIAEELGLFGAAAIIAAFVLFVGAGLRTALRADPPFEKLLAAGLTILLGVQSFIIMAGVTRLLPLTGVTLPFVSYGGSSLVANYVLLALLVRVSDDTAKRLEPEPAAP